MNISSRKSLIPRLAGPQQSHARSSLKNRVDILRRFVRKLSVLVIVFSLAGACAAEPAAQAHVQAAPPKVLLVTSLDGFRIASSLPWFIAFRKNYFRDYDNALEKIFRAAFRNRGFSVEVEHYADQYALAAYLHSSEYSAIYLVSHEAGLGTALPGMASGGLFDYNGYEITPVLNEIHPNVRIFALIGCISLPLTQKLYKQFRAAGTNPDLQLLGFSKKVDAKAGLKRVLNVSLPYLNRVLPTNTADCGHKQGYPVFFKRTCAGTTGGPAARIEAGGKVIAVFPRCAAGEVQSQHGFFESDGKALTAGQLKIQLTSGSNAYGPARAADLGQLEISRPGQSDDELWNLFAKPDGTPFGTSTHIYRHSGSLPAAWQIQDYHLYFGCSAN